MDSPSLSELGWANVLNDAEGPHGRPVSGVNRPLADGRFAASWSPSATSPEHLRQDRSVASASVLTPEDEWTQKWIAGNGPEFQRFQRPPKNVSRTTHLLSATGVTMSVRPVRCQL
jgi:hypothetical protein